jgi:hypothetical protein
MLSHPTQYPPVGPVTVCARLIAMNFAGPLAPVTAAEPSPFQCVTLAVAFFDHVPVTLPSRIDAPPAPPNRTMAHLLAPVPDSFQRI